MLIEKRIKNNIDNILLSIKYTCFLEEIKNTDKEIEILGGKKIVLGDKNKKLEKNKQYIKDFNIDIEKIKNANKPDMYLIVENNQLSDKLNMLSETANFNKIKYYIAIETIFDADLMMCKYKDSFMESISMILFSDKLVIKNIENKIIEIFKFITENKQDNELDLEHPLMKKFIEKMTIYMKKGPKSLIVGGGVLATGLFVVKTINRINLPRRANGLSKLPADKYLYELIRTAVAIFYEQQVSISRLEYQKIFRLYLKEINLSRKNILKNLYDKWYQVKDNKEKLKYLCNFDRFLIDNIKFDK